MLTLPVAKMAQDERLQICPRVRAGGHNNTKLNPVFRGMVCRQMAWIGNKRK
jgi:hypothetical protein